MPEEIRRAAALAPVDIASRNGTRECPLPSHVLDRSAIRAGPAPEVPQSGRSPEKHGRTRFDDWGKGAYTFLTVLSDQLIPSGDCLMLRSSLFTVSALALVASASAQTRQNPGAATATRINQPVKFAGTYHAATRTFTRGQAAVANFGTS
ncbi:MAG: hypothetical protein AAFZ87_14755, partial [Planctomycetota bacterium]